MDVLCTDEKGRDFERGFDPKKNAHCLIRASILVIKEGFALIFMCWPRVIGSCLRLQVSLVASKW